MTGVLPTEADVVIVGAGAAGIAAGRELARRGVPFLMLEARERLGGRAWTASIGGHALDLGCEWLHSADRNALAGLAAQRGMPLDKSLPPWRKRQPQRGFDLAAQDDFDGASAAFFTRLEEAAAEAARSGRDRPAADLLAPGCRWNGLLDAISTFYNGAPLARVSVVDFDRYIDTEVNWRIPGGYGAFIAGLAAELPVRLGCRVAAIAFEGRDVRIDTDQGTIRTRRAIITVPTGALPAIRFDARADAPLAAAAALPLGVADKLFLALDAAEAFAPDTRLLGSVTRADMGSYTIRANGRPLVEGYFGGDHARRLERGGLAAFVDAARADLAAAYGHDILRRVRPLHATGWAHDPFAQGSYSHALPGGADARAVLAAPIDDRLVFAGEATSAHFFSTAHGAWEEGERAVQCLLGTEDHARRA